MTIEGRPDQPGELAVAQATPPAQSVAQDAAPPRKRPSWLIIALPMVITIPWVAIMSPFKFVEDVFSIPAALTSAFLLSSVLLAIRRKNLPFKWALLPLLCWLYECLPITLPGPIDEFLAVGGSGMDVFWAWVKKPDKSNPPKGSLT
jgi:hypothetical protein